MTPHWQEILAGSGARIDNGTVSDFGDATAELAAVLRTDVIADLSPLAVIEVAGEDAAAFLGGQLTSDITALPPDRSSLSAWCSPQGRVLALFRAYRTRNAIFLLLPTELAETTLKRLRMYVLRSKVTVSDRSTEFMRIGLAGPATEALLAGHLPVPAGIDAVTHAEQAVVLRLPDRRLRYVVVGEPGFMAAVWKKLHASCRPVGTQAWALLDIESGLPQVTTATREKFVPQMLNLDVLGGLSFSKGCYPGQEIVARLKYRGQLKQRLHIGRADSPAVPAPGTRLGVTDSDMNAGEVVQACAHPDGGIALTAVVQMELAGSGRVHLGEPGGPVVNFAAPPYNFA